MIDVYFRDARPGDGDAVVPLLHESSRGIFDHLFGEVDPRPFLRRDFVRGGGIFGWRNLVVGIVAGQVVCTQTFYPGAAYPRLLRQSLASAALSFRPHELARIALRGRALGDLFITPRHDALFMANACVATELRGRGVFSGLIHDGLARARRAGLAFLELDVSFSNASAQRIFERFGFDVAAERPYTGRGGLDGFRRMRRPLTIDPAA